MGRGKSVKKLLLDSSQAALFAGIEVHNKPHIAYRYPTAVILIINAWELALKAYVYKYINRKKIYESDGQHTITFSKALGLVTADINSKEGKNTFKAVSENLDLLNTYRCSNVHFIESSLNPVIFMLINKAVLNYDRFLKKYFQRDISKDDNLIILPIGMKLPFDPIEYLKQDYGSANNDYVNQVIQSIKDLDDENIQDSIVIGFNVIADRVKNVKNADIIASIERSPDAVPLRKAVRITDDPNAPAMRVEPELLPLTYHELGKRVKEKRPDIKMNNKYNRAVNTVKLSPEYCQTRYLDPKKKTGLKKDYYSEKAIDKVIEIFDILNNNEVAK